MDFGTWNYGKSCHKSTSQGNHQLFRPPRINRRFARHLASQKAVRLCFDRCVRDVVWSRNVTNDWPQRDLDWIKEQIRSKTGNKSTPCSLDEIDYGWRIPIYYGDAEDPQYWWSTRMICLARVSLSRREAEDDSYDAILRWYDDEERRQRPNPIWAV